MIEGQPSRLIMVVVSIVSLNGVANEAVAHSRPLSYSRWQVDARTVRVRLQVSTADLRSVLAADPTGTAELEASAARALQRGLTLSSAAGGCRPRPAQHEAALGGWEIWSWVYDCPSRESLKVEFGFAELLLAGHRHLVRVDDASGIRDLVLELASPSCELTPRAGSHGSFSRYVALGVEHLWTGWDHIAFLLGLLLLADNVRQIVSLVTSFTLAHSVTLALAAFRFIVPVPSATETLIAFSVSLVAAENTWLLTNRGWGIPGSLVIGCVVLMLVGGGLGVVSICGLVLFTICHFALLWRPQPDATLRMLVAFAFGLIHGLGFAGAMNELDLPRAALVRALFGFNSGVELGQLSIVMLLWPIFRFVNRFGLDAVRLCQLTLTALICGLGVFWFVVRNFGG